MPKPVEFDPAKSNLSTIKDDFQAYGYTTANHVELALGHVEEGLIPYGQFRKVMIRGISYSLGHNGLNRKDAAKMRVALGHLIRGDETKCYMLPSNLDRYSVIPAASSFKKAK